MKIQIIWVGRTKERYISEGIDYYLKLLRNPIKLKIVEIKDSRFADRHKVISEEGKRILAQSTSYILLDQRGSQMSSEEFAVFLSRRDSTDFVIGGHYGVSDDVRKNASLIISLSKMTLTHEMVRLVFLEQLFRSITILKGSNYHH